MTKYALIALLVGTLVVSTVAYGGQAQVTATTPPDRPTAAATATGVQSPTATPEPAVAAEPTAVLEPTATPKPTAIPEPTATPVPSPTPEPTATPEPTLTPAPALTATPVPTATPVTQTVTAGSISMVLPSNWTETTDSALLQSLDGTAEYSGGIQGTVRVIAYVSPSEGFSLAGWAMAYDDAYAEYDSLDREPVTLPAGPAVKFEFGVSQDDGQTTAFTQYLLVEEGHMVLLSFLGSPNSAADFATTFEQIAESLVLDFPARPRSCAPEWDCEKPYTEFGNGLYEVGVDIMPGLYEATGGIACYWETLRSGFRGAEDIISSGTLSIVRILDSDDYFRAQGCGRWYLQD